MMYSETCFQKPPNGSLVDICGLKLGHVSERVAEVNVTCRHSCRCCLWYAHAYEGELKNGIKMDILHMLFRHFNNLEHART